MTIVFASDHAGLVLKEQLMKLLQKRKKMICIDVGASHYAADDDYPFFAAAGARKVRDTKQSKGIFVCGSGVGMSIVANRFRGIRAVNAESVTVVRRACREDLVNVLVLGSRIVTFAQAKKLVDTFLRIQPSQEKRHTRRVRLIENATK